MVGNEDTTALNTMIDSSRDIVVLMATIVEETGYDEYSD